MCSHPNADPAALGVPNLLPILRDEQEEIAERTFCWRVDRTRRRMKAIRHGDWKYVQDDMVEMLFNLRDDIGEHDDLYYERLDKMKGLKAKLAAWEAEVHRVPPPILIHQIVPFPLIPPAFSLWFACKESRRQNRQQRSGVRLPEHIPAPFPGWTGVCKRAGGLSRQSRIAGLGTILLPQAPVLYGVIVILDHLVAFHRRKRSA